MTAKQSTGSRRRYKQMSKAARKRLSAAQAAGQKRRWAKYSDEKRKAVASAIGKASKKLWMNATKSDRKKHSEKIKNGIKKMGRKKLLAVHARIQKTKNAYTQDRKAEVSAKLSRCYNHYGTKQTKPERVVIERLDKRSFKYTGTERTPKFGQPISADITHLKSKTIIQIDGCHWHGCPYHSDGRHQNKRLSDARLTLYARESGWKVVRIWEHEINNDLDKVIQKIMKAVGS